MNKVNLNWKWIIPFLLLWFNSTQVNAGCGSGYADVNWRPQVAYDKCTGILTINQFKYYERNSGDPDDIAQYLYVDYWRGGGWQTAWQMVRSSFTGSASQSEEEQTFYYGGLNGNVFSFSRTEFNIANWWRFANLSTSNIPQDIISSGQIKIRLRVLIQACCGGNHALFSQEYTIDVQDISAPSGLTATTNNCSNIVLSWQNSSQFWHSTASCAPNGEYNIDIYRNGSKIASVPAGTTSYKDNTTTLDASTDY